MPEQQRIRSVFFYVDGFNLYYGRLEETPKHKWLCLRTLAGLIFPPDKFDVVSIKYFTAEVDSRNPGSKKWNRQQTYWKALRNSGIEVIEGYLASRERRCKSTVCELVGARDSRSRYSEPAEKQSDVNLALHVYRDFIEKSPDVICVVSADLDLLPALKMIRETRRPVMLRVFLPSQGHRDLLHSRFSYFEQIAMTRELSGDHIAAAQFPDVVTLTSGEVVSRPSSWS